MAKLEGPLHLAGKHVCPAVDPPPAESRQSPHRSEGGARRYSLAQLMGRRAGHEDRRRVLGKPEEISADRTRHSGPIFSTKIDLCEADPPCDHQREPGDFRCVLGLSPSSPMSTSTRSIPASPAAS